MYDIITSSTEGHGSSTEPFSIELFITNLGEVLSGYGSHLRQLSFSYDAMQNLDWTTMFLVFWIIFGLLVYAAGNVLSLVIKRRKQCDSAFGDELNRGEKVSSNSLRGDNSKISKSDTKAKGHSLAYGPDDDCVHWINSILRWLFLKDCKSIEPLVNAWINALNIKAQKFTKDHGFFVQFVEIIYEHSDRPELSNIKVDLESNDNITTTCKISTPRLLLIIKVGENESSEDYTLYELNIEKLEGTIKVACITEELLLVLRFIERPDVKVSLKALKNPQKTLREDTIIDVILNAITNTVVDLCFSGFTDFPKFHRTIEQSGSLALNRERKIFVKVIKANSLGGSKGCTDPYCTIEVDEPPQKSQTSIIKNNSSPVWDEHFIFNLDDESSELLFELYDNVKQPKEFLGLGIVSVEELKNNPSQKQIITLQPRPLEEDDISGSLTVEFLFMEHSNRSESDSYSSVLPRSCSPGSGGGGGIVETNSKITPSGTLITTTTIRRPEHNGEVMHERNESIALTNGVDSRHPKVVTSTFESNQIFERLKTFGDITNINSDTETTDPTTIMNSDTETTDPTTIINSDTETTDPTTIEQNPNVIASETEPHNVNPFFIRDPIISTDIIQTYSPTSNTSHSHTQNPFSDSLPSEDEPSIIYDPFTVKSYNNTNPFLIEKVPKKFLLKAHSIDDVSITCMPTIKPVIVRRSSVESTKLEPLIDEAIAPNFRNNPFHSFSSYRKRKYLKLPTYSMPLSFFQPPFKLPPTPLFPSENYHDDNSNVVPNYSLNTNPFSCELLCNDKSSHSSSIESIVAINSGSSSDNSYTDCDSVILPNEPSPVTSKKKPKDSITSKECQSRKYPTGPKPNKPPPLPPTLSSQTFPTSKNRYYSETFINGDGMTHETVNILNNFGSAEFDLTETALKEVEGKYIIPNANKSTLMIHSVQREVIHSSIQSSENGSEEGYGTGRTTPSSQLMKIENESPSIAGESTISSQKTERSRSRSREPRSIIKAIRKRFSFNKNRSKSVEQRIDADPEPSNSRDSSVSVSSDRAKSVPNSREPSSPKDLHVNKLIIPNADGNGKIESVSNLSEISGYSTRTFVHEKSTLVIETNEDSTLKHYVIPVSLAHKTKWRRRGIKLHMYNDHLFLAKHISGSITCQVCSKLFSRRPGKQGYECRDCNYLCHKRCHVFVELRCPSSKISTMQFEHIVDPKSVKNGKHINNETQIEC